MTKLGPQRGNECLLRAAAEVLKAHEDAEASGRRVTAVYHSHVGAGAYLSEMDLAHAASDLFPFPGAGHIVVAVVDEKVDLVAFFRRDAEGGAFSGRTIVSSE